MTLRQRTVKMLVAAVCNGDRPLSERHRYERALRLLDAIPALVKYDRITAAMERVRAPISRSDDHWIMVAMATAEALAGWAIVRARAG